MSERVVFHSDLNNCYASKETAPRDIIQFKYAKTLSLI